MESPFEHSVDFELLGKLLAGECTAAEQAEAEAWIAASDDNRATWEALAGIWDGADQEDDSEAVNTDTAWLNVHTHVQNETLVLPLQDTRPRGTAADGFGWWRLAAVLIVGVGIGLFFLLRNQQADPARIIELTALDSPVQDTLPDGSVIRLNAHSTLRYPERFAEAERKVELQGEAFFDVARNPRQPFVIDAQSAEVRVLGTSFNVRTSKDLVDVVVETGKVRLAADSSTSAESVVLEAGQKGRVALETRKVETAPRQDNLDLYWLNQKLGYRKTRLPDVAAELSEIFGIAIAIPEEAVRNCKLDTEFSNQSIESILQVIATTFNLEVTQDENGYTLTGDGCP